MRSMGGPPKNGLGNSSPRPIRQSGRLLDESRSPVTLRPRFAAGVPLSWEVPGDFFYCDLEHASAMRAKRLRSAARQCEGRGKIPVGLAAWTRRSRRDGDLAAEREGLDQLDLVAAPELARVVPAHRALVGQ